MSIVRTISADIEPGTLGLTLCHEHLSTRPPDWAIERDPDLAFGSLDGARQELERYAAGGGALVEMTTTDYGRDARLALNAARDTGVHVVQATGLQKGTYYPPEVADATVEGLTAPMVSDIAEGIAGSRARAGVIKAGTCQTDVIRRDESRVFRAVAAAHVATGAPISTHTQAGLLGHEQLDELERAGVPPERVLLGHLDRNLDWECHRSLARRGVWLGYDHWTKEKYAPDALRVEFVQRLVDAGHTRVMVSGDLGRGSYQPAYGGWPGFATLLEHIGSLIQDEALTRLLIAENPATFFAFDPRCP